MSSGKELNKWADDFMFTAEKSDASAGPVAFLLGAPNDPLGQIAACGKMYKGEVVRDLADVTDAERADYLEQIQKTVLKMPLESVSMHFMVEGIHRGITHQMVRQRTAAFAQESTRFAVKEDMKEATALPPSLQGTLSMKEWKQKLADDDAERGTLWGGRDDAAAMQEAKGAQKQRLKWDEAVSLMGDTYMELVNEGMAAEEARGLMPTNITTRLNYITNLRSFYDTMAVRVSDQAQFEWRLVVMQMAKAMQTYGATTQYEVWMTKEEIMAGNVSGWGPTKTRADGTILYRVARSSEWQYVALSHEIKPIEFKIGGPAFGASFDRPSRIGERVRAFAQRGVPSSDWTRGSVEHNIPAIHPEEWLLDPNSARLDSTQEFDIYGNRVPKGTGLHWYDGKIFRTGDVKADTV
jgi:flavin-dependent thymidylate synthase